MVITTYANEETKKDKLSNDIFVLTKNVGDHKAGTIMQHLPRCGRKGTLTDTIVNSGKGKGSKTVYMFEYFEDGNTYATKVYCMPNCIRFATDKEIEKFWSSVKSWKELIKAKEAEEARKAKERLDARAEEERKRKEFAENYKKTLAYKIRFGLFYRPVGVAIFCFCSFLRTLDGCLHNLQFHWMNKMYKNLYLSRTETWNMQYEFADIATKHSHKWFKRLTKISALNPRCSHEYDYAN